MSTDAGPDLTGQVAASPHPQGRSRLVSMGVDAAAVLLWCAVAGVVGGFVWRLITPLPYFVRTKTNAVMSTDELMSQFGPNGWFFVIAVVLGLASGLVLTFWRQRTPLWTVALIAVGGFLAAALMALVGQHLGPESPQAALSGSPVGTHIYLQLTLTAPGLRLVWPIAALLGALGVLVATPGRTSTR